MFSGVRINMKSFIFLVPYYSSQKNDVSLFVTFTNFRANLGSNFICNNDTEKFLGISVMKCTQRVYEIKNMKKTTQN